MDNLKNTFHGSPSTSTVSVPNKTVTRLVILSGLYPGTYLVLGSACITPDNSDTIYSMKISINTTETFNNKNAGGVIAYKSFATAMNCYAILTITGDEALFLMTYHECGGERPASNIKLQAIKLY